MKREFTADVIESSVNEIFKETAADKLDAATQEMIKSTLRETLTKAVVIAVTNSMTSKQRLMIEKNHASPFHLLEDIFTWTRGRDALAFAALEDCHQVINKEISIRLAAAVQAGVI